MKLNQIIALEKGVKSKVNADVDAIYKAAQKPALFDGFSKKYRRKTEEDTEEVPPQTQNVQLKAGVALAAIAHRWTELFDITAQKDFANCDAKADVAVDGTVLLAEAPVTYLLFLEKQLTDLFTIVSKFPTLDPAEVWSFDTAAGIHKTEPTLTTRTKKVQRPIVLYDATKEHPAQTQLITEDVAVGTWELTKASGALPEPEHKALLARIAKVHTAIKAAREAANMIDAPRQDVGSKVFGWIFAS